MTNMQRAQRDYERETLRRYDEQLNREMSQDPTNFDALVAAMGKAYDTLDHAVMNCTVEPMNCVERAVFDKACSAKNKLEKALALSDENRT